VLEDHGGEPGHQGGLGRHAAQRASGAPSVVATSALAPSAPLVRAVLPLAGVLLSVPALRRTAVRRLAAVTTRARPRPREHSWGHAVVTWPDGTVRARAGCGAFTPAAAFGAGLAESAGGTFLLDQG